MAAFWQGDSMLVRVSGVVRLCCPDPASTLLAPPARYPLYQDPRHATAILDSLHSGGRYTILPTISVVAPWDDPLNHDLPPDSALSGSQVVKQVLAPTPVIPPLTPTGRPAWVGEAALNATHRFYNVLRAVLHGGEDQAAPALRGEDRRSVEEVSAEVTPKSAVLPTTTPAIDPALSPLIQVCAALAVVVVVMVLLFHWHHVRQECLMERRALRRLARRYRATRDLHSHHHHHDNDHDVEKNDSSDVTDVTL
ncbi:hypothetical protein GWK47_013976 [Chionoecetes opilio]|uniref:Uncharacterized protein n=1 Tax=Chionoecetes opilio TaxID=41210 RepID=A0A8J4XTL5_CHIOP|nr:hypothetical protein GWK47_013976 [Chionoecetes opilio]